MKQIQDGSLVRLALVTDVTGSDEAQPQQAHALSASMEDIRAHEEQMEDTLARVKSLEDAEFRLQEVQLKDIHVILTRLQALEDAPAEGVELDDFETLENRVEELTSELNEYPSPNDIITRDDDVVTDDDVINALIDKRLEGQVTSVTSSLVRVLLAECPTVADELGKQYMLEREHIIESNKTVEHRINFPSNQRMAEEASLRELDR